MNTIDKVSGPIRFQQGCVFSTIRLFNHFLKRSSDHPFRFIGHDQYWSLGFTISQSSSQNKWTK